MYLQFQGFLFLKSFEFVEPINLFLLDFDHEIDRHVAYCMEYIYCFQPMAM